MPTGPIQYKTGVYRWFCRMSTKSYVGGAYVSLRKREYEHRRELRAGTHFNRHLQAAWNLYGEDSFEFHVLMRCSAIEVKGWEQYWIDGLQSYLSCCGYNKAPTAASTLGFKWSDEAKRNMSEVAKKRSPELVALQSERMIKAAAARAGKPRNPEAVAKAAKALRGRKRSPETIAKIVAARMASDGFKLSPEALAKMRERMRSPETRERCRQAALNRKKK